MQIIQIINNPTSIDFKDDNIKRISEKVIYTILDNCSGTTYLNIPSTINIIKLQEKIPLSNLYNTALSHVEDSFFTISTDINFISLEDIDNMLSLITEHPNAKMFYYNGDYALANYTINWKIFNSSLINLYDLKFIDNVDDPLCEFVFNYIVLSTALSIDIDNGIAWNDETPTIYQTTSDLDLKLFFSLASKVLETIDDDETPSQIITNLSVEFLVMGYFIMIANMNRGVEIQEDVVSALREYSNKCMAEYLKNFDPAITINTYYSIFSDIIRHHGLLADVLSCINEFTYVDYLRLI